MENGEGSGESRRSSRRGSRGRGRRGGEARRPEDVTPANLEESEGLDFFDWDLIPEETPVPALIRPTQPATVVAPQDQTQRLPQTDLPGAAASSEYQQELAQAVAPLPPREPEPNIPAVTLQPTPTPTAEALGTQPATADATLGDESSFEPSQEAVEENAEPPSKPRSRRRRGGRGRRGRGNSSETTSDQANVDESSEAEGRTETSVASDLQVETVTPVAHVPSPQDQPLVIAKTREQAETKTNPEKLELAVGEPSAPINIAKPKAKTSVESSLLKPETPATSPTPSPRRKRATNETSEEGENLVETGPQAAATEMPTLKEGPPPANQPAMAPTTDQEATSQANTKAEPEILDDKAITTVAKKAAKLPTEAESNSPEPAPALGTTPQRKGEEVKVKSPKASGPAAPKPPKTPKAPKAEPAATAPPKVSDKSSLEEGDPE